MSELSSGESVSQENKITKVCTDADLPVTNSDDFKRIFYEKLFEFDQQHQGSQHKPWTEERIYEVINEINKAKRTKRTGQRRTPMGYYWINKYDVLKTPNDFYLIFKKLTPTEPAIRIVAREHYFDILSEIHNSMGHCGRDKILAGLNNKYYIPKKAIELFVSLCPICKKKKSFPKKNAVTRRCVSNNLNNNGQFCLINFQSCADGEYKWLLMYQDCATKFISLRPLKTKQSSEVAIELIKIFLSFGAPYKLHSDEARVFATKVLTEIKSKWPNCKTVYGTLRRSLKHKRVKQSIYNILQSWMKKSNSTNWSIASYFVQYRKNALFRSVTGSSPYKAVFGCSLNADLAEFYIPTFKETEKQLKNLPEKFPANDVLSDSSKNNSENIRSHAENIEEVGNLKQNLTYVMQQNETTHAPMGKSCNNVVHVPIKRMIKHIR